MTRLTRDGTDGCRIRAIGAADRADWSAHWSACEYATFFHGPDWADVWERYTQGGMRPAARLVEFDDGATALLPLSQQRGQRGWIRSHVSSPAGTYGGWVSADPLSTDHTALLTGHLRERAGDLLWRVNPFAPGAPGTDVSQPGEITHALDLRGGFDAARARWRSGLRRAVAKARRSEVSVSRAESEEDWRAYFEVYQDALRRWGADATTRYDWPLFDALRELRSPDVSLWLARHEGRVVSGALCLSARRHVAYWHGATREAAFPLRPAQLVFHEAIEDACERGVHWFDFGPSAGREGVEEFKRGFGAAALACPLVRRASLRGRALLALARWLHVGEAPPLGRAA